MRVRILSLKDIIKITTIIIGVITIISLVNLIINEIKNLKIENVIEEIEQSKVMESVMERTNMLEENIEKLNLEAQNNEIDIEVQIPEEVNKNNVLDDKAYVNIPKEIKGYTVIGKLYIPKINVSTYILEDTNKNSLNIAVTKLYGPAINNIGNFCITGHNLKNTKMFGNLSKLELNDQIILTDIYDRKRAYIVYDIYTVDPKDTSVLEQNTDYERRVTLITCTPGAFSRLIIKALEYYD